MQSFDSAEAVSLPPSLFDQLPLELTHLILDFSVSLIIDNNERQISRIKQLTVNKQFYNYSRFTPEYFLDGQIQAQGVYQLMQKYQELRLVVKEIHCKRTESVMIGFITQYCRNLEELVIYAGQDMIGLGAALLGLKKMKNFRIYTLLEKNELDAFYRALESWPLLESLELHLHFLYPWEQVPRTTSTVLAPPPKLRTLRVELNCFELIETLESLVKDSNTIEELTVGFGDGDWGSDTINEKIKNIFETVGPQLTLLDYADFDERLEEISPMFIAIPSIEILEVRLGSSLSNLLFTKEMPNLKELTLHDVLNLEMISSHLTKNGAGKLKKITCNLSDEYEMDGEAAREFARITDEHGIQVTMKDAWD